MESPGNNFRVKSISIDVIKGPMASSSDLD